MKTFFIIACAIGLLSFTQIGLAAPGMSTTPKHNGVSNSDPVLVIRNASEELIGELKKQKKNLKTNQKIIYDLVRKVVMPHIDVNVMTKLVLGRAGYMEWKKSPTALQNKFIEQFTDLVIGTYASALASYENEKVEVYPPRGGVGDKTQVSFTSKIFTKGPPVNMRYVMRKSKNVWRLIDFSVEGISLIRSYQTQFEPILAEGGLKHLVNTLQKHNDKVEKKQ